MPPLQIINAINKRLYLAFEYDGIVRLVEPHCLGTKHLRAWQIFPEAGWRLFDIGKLKPATFEGPRPRYNPNDLAVGAPIIAALPPLVAA